MEWEHIVESPNINEVWQCYYCGKKCTIELSQDEEAHKKIILFCDKELIEVIVNLENEDVSIAVEWFKNNLERLINVNAQ